MDPLRRIARPAVRGTALDPQLDAVIAVEDVVEPGRVFAERILGETLIFAVAQGEAVTTIDGRSLRYASGCVGAVAAGVRFAQRIGPRPLHSHYLLLRGSWARQLDAALARSGRVVIVERAAATWHRALVEAVSAAISDAAHWDWCLASAVALLSGALIKAGGTPHDSNVVARVHALVDAEPERPWRVGDLARRLAMSESALAHR
nr:helix-turn-helix transcriptional regulator [Planctomycetota bacterium]